MRKDIAKHHSPFNWIRFMALGSFALSGKPSSPSSSSPMAHLDTARPNECFLKLAMLAPMVCIVGEMCGFSFSFEGQQINRKCLFAEISEGWWFNYVFAGITGQNWGTEWSISSFIFGSNLASHPEGHLSWNGGSVDSCTRTRPMGASLM